MKASTSVKIAIVGLGNVGCTFVRGLNYYSNNTDSSGLWHKKVGGLGPSKIMLVAVFDTDPSKVGKELSEIIAQDWPNHPGRARPELHEKIRVDPGLLAPEEISSYHRKQLDGSNDTMPLPESQDQSGSANVTSTNEFVQTLKSRKVEVVLNLISSGLDRTSAQYAKASMQANAAFVNATPARIATDTVIARKFASKNIILVGDDLMSQFGGTAFHKGMIDFMVERGVHVKKSYQLDIGGSIETKNTMNQTIKMNKRTIKTGSIAIEAPYKFQSVAGTTEYTDFLGDSRNSYYWMSGEGFLGSEITMDLTLKTNDSANAGNVLLDIVRAIVVSKKTNVRKTSEIISAYGFKKPPRESGIRKAYSNFVKTFV